eukprot:m.298630 g.298630  ORF g.298630 m.298630 type:complete len:151 (-) comp16409_c1_seq33:75-527(-)
MRGLYPARLNILPSLKRCVCVRQISSEKKWSVKELLEDPRKKDCKESIDVDIPRLCKMAYLPLPENIDELQSDLQRMLLFTGKVQDVDTTGVTPKYTVVQEFGPLRKDTVEKTSVENIIPNAPESFEHFFVAPKEEHFQQHNSNNKCDKE